MTCFIKTICCCTALGPKFCGVYCPFKFQSALRLGSNEQQEERDKKNAMNTFNYVTNFRFLSLYYNDITVANRQWVRSTANQSVIPILHVY